MKNEITATEEVDLWVLCVLWVLLYFKYLYVQVLETLLLFCSLEVLQVLIPAST